MNRRIIADITEFIFLAGPPQRADIIFLPGGSYPELPEYAAQLYKDGFADTLLPSGGVSVKTNRFNGVKARQEVYHGAYQTECAFYCDVLCKNGVPPGSIYPEDQSGHTRDNAFFSRRVADEQKLSIQTAIIVCKSFHARRCLMLYQLAFPETELIVCPVDCNGLTRDSWHTFDQGVDRVLGELSRCGNQFAGDIKDYLTRAGL